MPKPTRSPGSSRIYKPEQTRLMKVDPLSKGQMMDEYALLLDLLDEAEGYQLVESNEEVPAERMDAMFRYTAWVYDPASPMVKSYPDLTKRRDAASDMTGWEPTKGTIYLEVLFLKNVVRSLEWRLIIANERRFIELEEIVSAPIARGNKGDVDKDVMSANERKTKALAEMNEIMDRLPTLYSRLLHGDKALEEKEQTMRMTPEKYAAVTKTQQDRV